MFRITGAGRTYGKLFTTRRMNASCLAEVRAGVAKAANGGTHPRGRYCLGLHRHPRHPRQIRGEAGQPAPNDLISSSARRDRMTGSFEPLRAEAGSAGTRTRRIRQPRA